MFHDQKVFLAAFPLIAGAQPIAAPTPNVALPAPANLILIQDDKEEARAALEAYLPEPMEGWTREIVADVDASQVPMLGDGYVAQAEYRGPNGTVSLAMVVDAPMVAQMVPMFGNAAMMAMLGEVIEIDGRSFIKTETNDIVALIDGRILLNASGNAINQDDVIAYIEGIDFEGLESFNR